MEAVNPDAPVSSRKPLMPLAALWAVVWFLLVLIENTGYLHDRSLPRWQPLVVFGIPIAILVIWLRMDIRSSRYEAVPLEPTRAWFLSHLRRLPWLASGYVVSAFGLRQLIFTAAGAQYWHRPWPELIIYEYVKASLLYGLWLGLVYGTLSMLRVREQSAQLSRVRRALVEAQLARLQSQLRPHFLFNTLNTVSALMHVDVARADRVLTRLGDLLRTSLGAAERAMVPMAEEICILELYAGIMEERFAGRIEIEWRIDAPALAVAVPAMLLQPLLENAFKYGVEETTGAQRIVVSAMLEGGRLLIHIRNSGSLLAPQWQPGIGIGNCRARLGVLYGGAAQVELANHDEGGVVASLSLPVDGVASAPV